MRGPGTTFGTLGTRSAVAGPSSTFPVHLKREEIGPCRGFITRVDHLSPPSMSGLSKTSGYGPGLGTASS